MATGNLRLIAGAGLVEVEGATGMVFVKNGSAVHNLEYVVFATADTARKVTLFPSQKDEFNIRASEKLWAETNSQDLDLFWGEQ